MKINKNCLAWIYILAVFFVVPLYNEGSFDNITQRKIVAYHVICIFALIFYFVVSLIGDIRKSDDGEPGKQKKPLLMTDIMMAAFVGVSAVSTLLSDFKQEAIYGVPGFGMGLLTIVLMALSYFLISRELVCDDRILHIIAASSVIPTVLVIVNRLGFDPLHMYPEGADPAYHLYVSTIGNYGWYNQYMSVIIPISIYMIFVAKELLVKAMYAAHLLLCLVAWCLAGTKSLMISVVAVLCAMLLWKVVCRDGVKVTSKLLTLLMTSSVISYIGIILVCMSNDSYANGRGYIWKLSGGLLKNFNIRELLLGVGPNCYTYALDEFLLTDQNLLAEFNANFGGLALTSSHSEYFDYLIGIGIIGVVIYIVMLGVFINSFVKRDITSRCQNAAMLCVISYIVYGMLSFSVVVATPMFFIMLGIAGGDKENRPR
ncbi:O-antigen ligase family protein [Butyrivibrio sp. XPD2006]|uniref:O-antigen ligase family protein n=1 Tax=Butyrivibrio sp. XPD2006 TaxID=1280668 RepID=UPI0012DC6840|nr:O-antigen ligase family protein [Butyrivibrio sp. XPD2006]